MVKKLLLLVMVVSGGLFAQAPQALYNVGQIQWWGYPQCTWTMSGGVITAPCLAGGGGGVITQTNGTNNTTQGLLNLINGPVNSGFSLSFTNPSGGIVSPSLGFSNQNVNTFFAGPGSGSATVPAWRTLVPADLPVATNTNFGAVKPDNTTITISGGVISSVGGGTSVIHVITANGATPDGILLNDGAMTNGSAILTSASGDFTVSSVGKYVEVVGAIAAGNSTLETTIASYQSPTQVTLALPATATITNAQFVFGTNNTTTAQLALDNLGNAGGGTMLFPAPTSCPTNATCGYIISTTDQATNPNPSGLKIRQSNIKLQGENNGIYTNIFTRGAWSNIGGVVTRGNGINIGDSTGTTSVSNISVEGIHMWSLTTGQTSNSGINATVALNGDGWDQSNKAIFIYPNVAHNGGVQIKNSVFEDFKGENIYSGGTGLPSLLVQNVTMLNSNASMISSSAYDFKLINSVMKFGWNGVENGLFGSLTTTQMFVNNVISHMGASGITVTGVDSTNTSGAIEIFGNQMDTIGMIYPLQQRSGIYIGIQSGLAPSKITIDHNTCVDCYDFLQAASLINSTVSNNIQTIDQYNSQAFFIAPALMKNNLFANNSIQYSTNAIANGFNISYVYSLNGGSGPATLNWFDNTFRNNTWNATGAIYNFFDTAISGWAAFAVGAKQISFIGDVCNGCALPDNPSKGQITISSGGTINPYGAQVLLTGGSTTSAMTVDASKMQDAAELLINNQGSQTVTLSADTNLNLAGTLSILPTKSVRLKFSAADNQWHSSEGGGSGGTTYVAGNSGGICVGTCSGQASNVIDLVTSVSPRVGSTNTWPGANFWTGVTDASNATETIPSKNVSVLPGTCVIGEVAFLTTASAGQNLNVCNPANTWNTVGSGGGSTVVANSPYLQIGSNYYLPSDAMYQATKNQLSGWIKMMTTPSNLTVTSNSPGDVSLFSTGVNYSYIMQSASLTSIEISYRMGSSVSNYTNVGVFAVDTTNSIVRVCGEQTNPGGGGWANSFVANYNGASVDPGAIGVVGTNLTESTQGHLKLAIVGGNLTCSNNIAGTVYNTPVAVGTIAYLGIVVSNVNPAEIYSVKLQ